jgi:hypothetical protein
MPIKHVLKARKDQDMYAGSYRIEMSKCEPVGGALLWNMQLSPTQLRLTEPLPAINTSQHSSTFFAFPLHPLLPKLTREVDEDEACLSPFPSTTKTFAKPFFAYVHGTFLAQKDALTLSRPDCPRSDQHNPTNTLNHLINALREL